MVFFSDIFTITASERGKTIVHQCEHLRNLSHSHIQSGETIWVTSTNTMYRSVEPTAPSIAPSFARSCRRRRSSKKPPPWYFNKIGETEFSSLDTTYIHRRGVVEFDCFWIDSAKPKIEAPFTLSDATQFLIQIPDHFIPVVILKSGQCLPFVSRSDCVDWIFALFSATAP